MIRMAVLLVLGVALAGCGVVDTLIDGFKHAKAVEASLETATHVRPQVGFNFSNGRLVSVTVTYPRLMTELALPDLAAAVRRAVTAEFRQTPGDIVLSFSLGKSDPGRVALAR